MWCAQTSTNDGFPSMNVNFKNRAYPFVPWKPTLGRVFTRAFAFDTETTRIDEERPWLPPAYVLGAGFDGKKGYFVRRDHVAAFLEAHSEPRVVFHNAPFDLAVIHLVAPEVQVYDRVDQHRVWDTQLLHRLLALGTGGHAAQ